VLARLPVFNALISETMRLYPTAATSGSRVITEDSTHIAGYQVPKGVVVWSQQYSLHVM
jgi:cytochrome P450